MPKHNRSKLSNPGSDSVLVPTAISLEASIIDTRETVGMSVDGDHVNSGSEEAPYRSGSDISLGLHPCVCCNVSHRKGIIIIAMLEIIHWGMFLVFCTIGITYWVVAKDPESQIGGVTYSRANMNNYILLQNVLITYGVFCAVFLSLGIGLLFGVRKEKTCLILTWLIGTFIIEILRMIFAILIPISEIRYGLLLWLPRVYEYWVIISFYNRLRKEAGPKKKRRRGLFGWGRRRRLSRGESVIPALVPITYYGVVKDNDEDLVAVNIVGYQLQGEDLDPKENRKSKS